jgi:hypothetical protein
MPVFYEKSAELKERMAWLIEHDPNHEYPDVNKDGAPLAPKPENLVAGARKMDMARFYTDLAFDIIGVAGFDYEFQGELCFRWG